MKRHNVPGVSVGIYWQGREYLKGLRRHQRSTIRCPVDADTMFRIGSTTKTFTATAHDAAGRAGQGRSRGAGAHTTCRTSRSPTKRWRRA